MQIRNARGEFASRSSVDMMYRTEDGANRGGQTWIGGRYHAEGIKLNMESLTVLLGQPWILAEVQRRTDQMLQDAQSIAVLDEAMYGKIVYNNRPELGPVGVVFCDNYPSVIDDGMNQTLHKVLAMHHGK